MLQSSAVRASEVTKVKFIGGLGRRTSRRKPVPGIGQTVRRVAGRVLEMGRMVEA